MDIEIKERSKSKEFVSKIRSKSEDMLFSIIEKMPEKLIPTFAMNWMERYLDKRVEELKREQVKGTWRQVELEKAVEEIRGK